MTWQGPKTQMETVTCIAYWHQGQHGRPVPTLVARANLDRHAAHSVAAYLAGMAIG